MKKNVKSRLLSLFLSLTMVLSILPSTAFAATTTTASDTTSTNVAKVQNYAKQLRSANSAGKTTGGFSWDTESKKYSWAYFNGLMLDAFGMIGGDENLNYIDTFYGANINSDGTPANLASGSASTGALDSVEPIRAIFDVLSSSSNKEKYQEAIQYIYSMLENQITYDNAGGNYAHKQSNGSVDSSWSSYPVALDGLYMAEPFLMECANAIESGDLTLTTEDILYADLSASSSINLASYDDEASEASEPEVGEEPVVEEEKTEAPGTVENQTVSEDTSSDQDSDGEETVTIQSAEDDTASTNQVTEISNDGEEESVLIESQAPAQTESDDAEEQQEEIESAASMQSDEASVVSDDADTGISLASTTYTVDPDAIYEAVYNRMTWVYDNMYDEDTGLYMHAYSPESGKTNGVAWSRSIGWYAMALVDIIDMMPKGTYRSDLISYLPRLFDGLLKYQDETTGMWYNVPASGSSLSKNELETSGTSMFAYAMMKAYNNGWVTDSKYANAALKAFNGVVANKMTGSEGNYSVSGTYLKSGVSTSASGYTTYSYTTNEAKGVGALIMASTLANETAEKLAASGEAEPVTPPATLSDKDSGISVSGAQATGITIKTNTASDDQKAALDKVLESGYTVYDITLDGYTQGTEATVKIPLGDYDADKAAVYYVSDDAEVTKMEGSVEDGYYVFKTTHFSDYALGEEKADAVSADGYLAKEEKSSSSETVTVYKLATSIDTSKTYYIGSGTSGNITLLGHNGTSAAKTTVSVSDSKFYSPSSFTSGESNYQWTFSTASGNGTVSNKNGNTYYIRLAFSQGGTNTSIFTTSSSNVTITKQSGNGAYRITGKYSATTYYLSASGGRTTSQTTVYLYEKTTEEQTTETTSITKGDPVNFSVTPATASLNAYNKETVELNPTVTVDGSAADSSKITWSSSDTSVATVNENGKVTSVAEGTADITATLTQANETNLYNEKTASDDGSIVVTIPITVTYTEEKAPIQDYDYDDVSGEAEKYPEYPDDGAVRIEKTASGYNFNSTGVANVELDVAGVSVKTGVDVVLVVDVSNSMAWNVDKLKEGKTGQNACPDEGENSKLDDVVESADLFADILLGGNTGNIQSDNTISLVTFGGYDKENTAQTTSYFDSTQTVFSAYSSAEDAKKKFDGMSIVYDSSSGTGYKLTINGVTGNNYGNTNYDYAFYEAYNAINSLQSDYTSKQGISYADSGRETYVVFMTDGAPSNYEYKYYKNNSNDYYPGTTTKYTVQGSSSTCSQDDWYSFISTTKNTQAKRVYDLVDGEMTVIGFDLDHGGFNSYQWTGDLLPAFLRQMIEDTTLNVNSADDAATLKTFYESLANQFKLAGTKAQVTDLVNPDYTLQTTSTVGTDSPAEVPSTITVTSYELYTKADTSDVSKIGTRTGESIVLETVTFSDDGTKAYSSVLGATKNIKTNNSDGSVKIDAYYFTYTKSADGTEKFVWKIGDITDDEIALSYYVYLKGALEGKASEGIHYTNDGKAKLEYVDINGDKASKEFAEPALVWGGASTAYEFYLVNASGQPVNHAGEVVPFANRVIVYGPEYKVLNLNQGDTEAAKVNAKDVLPEGYYLYDEEAYYTVKSTSGTTVEGELTVSDPSSDASATKGGQKQTGAQTTIVVSFDEKNYTESRVAFGIRYDMTPTYVDEALTNDKIVIDYGEPINVDVLANDPETITSNKGATKYDGYSRQLVGYTAYNANANLKQAQTSPGSANYDAKYGYFTIGTNDKVLYTPTGMISSVERVFCVVKFYTDSDEFYLYEELDIIPATIMYYETDFSTTDIVINSESDMKKHGTTRSSVQDDGTIGVNQTYGYDSTYLKDKNLSADSSYYINNETGYEQTVASFTFTGTGFDLISRTGEYQGAIQVKIYSDAEKTSLKKTINVLNKSESQLELYQIPVVSATVDYGTYYVDVIAKPSYTAASTSLTFLNRGGEFYFDALRVYNPIDTASNSVDAKLASDAYNDDGEADMTLTELRKQLIDGDAYSLDDDPEEGTSGVFYIDRTQEGAKLATYTTIGPDNEVYLTSGETLAFEVNLSKGIPASYDIGAKSADGNDATLHVSVYDADEEELIGEVEETLKSSTVQYYGIFDKIYDQLENVNSVIVVVDTNEEDGILSVTDLKSTGGTAPTLVASTAAKSIVFNAMAPVVEETVEADYDVKSAEITSAKVVRNKNVTMSVVTGADVTSLTVTNKAGKAQSITTDVTDNADGTKTWTVTFKVTGTGTQVYTIAGFGSDGNSGETVSVSAKVSLK